MQNFDLVWQKAETVFGDKSRAAVWLSTPRHLFDGMPPWSS
ncbi:MbcA/ParS/Xre antitoxin family protein [Pseudomonas cichorii]|nr:MbcA/ParS/Xre antitoxin family protein [Pseudomonas cichorii]